MTLTLYSMNISPPARAVKLAIRNLGININIKNVDLIACEHLTPEFVKLNPRHMIPVLTDSDFVLTESRAIMAYLVNFFKPGCSLYPNDPKKRAKIDEKLYFDATVVFERNCAIVKPTIEGRLTEVPEALKLKVSESMSLLDSFIKDNSWFAGDTVTIADLTILANVSQIQACGYNISQQPDLFRWLEQCKKLPGFDENQSGADELGKMFKAIIPNLF